MTEKRYEAYYDKYMEDWKVQDILTLDILPCVSEKVAKEFANRLNNSYCANKKLLKSNDFLLKEIEQLKERNNRQAKQLDDLYRLIEEKDWRALSDIMDDFKKAEEQLQSEGQTYGDERND